MREFLMFLVVMLVLFGGMMFWPLVRYGAGQVGGVATWLKWQFFGHIALLAGNFALPYYYHAMGAFDRAYPPLHPFAIGILSWMSALAILIGAGIWRRIGTDSSPPD